MPVIRYGQGGRSTHVVCGYLICEDPMFDPRLRVFPPVFVVSPTTPGPPGTGCRPASSTPCSRPHGSASTASRLPAADPRAAAGGDPQAPPRQRSGGRPGLGQSGPGPGAGPGARCHPGSPERKWTVASLAQEARVSVSLLDERFREVLGIAPIRYLTGWRMHVAEDLLRSTDLGRGRRGPAGGLRLRRSVQPRLQAGPRPGSQRVARPATRTTVHPTEPAAQAG